MVKPNGEALPAKSSDSQPEVAEGVSPTDPNQPEAEPTPSIHNEVEFYLRRLDALNGVLPVAMIAMGGIGENAVSKLNLFLRTKGNPVGDGSAGEPSEFRIPPEYQREYGRYVREVDKIEAASDVVPEMFLVALVSQFDAFLGRLLKCVFQKRPELLTSSERKLTYSELVAFKSVEKAQEFVLEKEVESVIRKSHAEQFTWMEQRFAVELRKELPIWSVYIELTERRNLFAHTDGYVSSQYHEVCKDHKYGDPSKLPAIGTRLSVDPDYLHRAYLCLYEIGTKLAYVLWRKLFPDEIGQADSSLNNVLFELIAAERYDLAIILGKFSAEVFKKWGNDELKLFMKINLAQAYKWSGNADKCKELITKVDWSACGNNFKLAVAILSEQYDEAADLMKRIGAAGEVKEHDYKDWPIFREFRKHPTFLAAYEAIYGKKFAPIEKIVTKVNAKAWEDLKINHVYESEGRVSEPPSTPQKPSEN